MASVIQDIPRPSRPNDSTAVNSVKRKEKGWSETPPSKREHINIPKPLVPDDPVVEWISTPSFHTRINFERLDVQAVDLVKYFGQVVAMTGCAKDYFVVSKAWQLCCGALSIASHQDQPDVAHPLDSMADVAPSHSGTGHPLPSALRAVIVGSVALAVDVSADFEALFVESALTWGHFFFCQVTERGSHLVDADTYNAVKENARQLMRMKVIISKGLLWNLRTCSAADAFGVIVDKLTKEYADKYPSSIGATLTESRIEFVRFAERVLHWASFALQPADIACPVTATIALVVGYSCYPVCRTASISHILTVTGSSLTQFGIHPALTRLYASLGLSTILDMAVSILHYEASVSEIVKLGAEFESAMTNVPSTRVLTEIQESYDSPAADFSRDYTSCSCPEAENCY